MEILDYQKVKEMNPPLDPNDILFIRCDRCGSKYEDVPSIKNAVEEMGEWEKTLTKDGDFPRGICPCPLIPCEGELIVFLGKRPAAKIIVTAYFKPTVDWDDKKLPWTTGFRSKLGGRLRYGGCITKMDEEKGTYTLEYHSDLDIDIIIKDLTYLRQFGKYRNRFLYKYDISVDFEHDRDIHGSD